MARSATILQLPVKQLLPKVQEMAEVTCIGCCLKRICLPSGLEKDHIGDLESVIRSRQIYRKGQHVFRQDTNFHSLYVVRSGAIKTYTVTEQGEEQVTGFYLPGELIGLDAIFNKQYSNSALALESSSVCEVVYQQLEILNSNQPSLQQLMFRLMSREIQAEQQMLSVLTKKSAEARLANLLVNISNRLQLLHRSESHFQLPMTRADIGNFLGMATETVSRVFARLSKIGLIIVCQRELNILDLKGLVNIAGINLHHDYSSIQDRLSK